MGKVLIVDDTAFMRLILGQIVHSIPNVKIVGESKNGLEALRQYRLVSPDLVIMDIIMPEMDGITALKELIQFDPAAKVIVCSTLGEKNVVIDAVRNGAIDFLIKPIDKDRAIAIIRNVLKK